LFSRRGGWWLGALQPTLELALVSDEEIAALNSDWRGKAGPIAIPSLLGWDHPDEDGLAACWPHRKAC